MIAGGGVAARLIAFPSLLGSTYIAEVTHLAVGIKPGNPNGCVAPSLGPNLRAHFPFQARRTRARGWAVGDDASPAARRAILGAWAAAIGGRGCVAVVVSRSWPGVELVGPSWRGRGHGAAVSVLAMGKHWLGVGVIASPVALPRPAGTDHRTGRVWIARRPGRCMVPTQSMAEAWPNLKPPD